MFLPGLNLDLHSETEYRLSIDIAEIIIYLIFNGIHSSFCKHYQHGMSLIVCMIMGGVKNVNIIKL